MDEPELRKIVEQLLEATTLDYSDTVADAFAEILKPLYAEMYSAQRELGAVIQSLGHPGDLVDLPPSRAVRHLRARAEKAEAALAEAEQANKVLTHQLDRRADGMDPLTQALRTKLEVYDRESEALWNVVRAARAFQHLRTDAMAGRTINEIHEIATDSEALVPALFTALDALTVAEYRPPA